jgi:hypothetical protein
MPTILESNRTQFEAKLKELLEALSTGIVSGSTITPARLEIINYTKAKLDELLPEAEGLTFNLSAAPNVSNPLDLLINAHLDESTKNIIMSAPLSALMPQAATVAPVPSTDLKTGYFMLPIDFLRLSAFKMVEWLKEVTVAIGMNDPLYAKQTNPFLRGKATKPVAVFKWKDSNSGGIKTVAINAGGTGFAAGSNLITVVQSGASFGKLNCTASAGGIITSIDSIESIGDGYVNGTALATTGGTGANFTVNITAYIGMKRILEYYSVSGEPDSEDVDYFLYIPEMTSEEFVLVNPNFLDSLAWMCAGKIMQITGQVEAYKMAMEQVKISFINLPQ